MTLAAPPLQDAIGVDLQPWREGVKEEHIEQLYCGLGEASLHIQVPSFSQSLAAVDLPNHIELHTPSS